MDREIEGDIVKPPNIVPGLIASAIGAVAIVVAVISYEDTQSIFASAFASGVGLIFGLVGVYMLLGHTEWFQRHLDRPIHARESTREHQSVLSTYEISEPETPASLIFQSVVGTVFGGAFLAFGLMLLSAASESGPIALVFGIACVLIGGGTFHILWRGLTQTSHEAKVYSDGTVEFVKTFRPTLIHASQIERIKLTGKKDDENRQIRIEHTAGKITVDHFEQVEDFVSELSVLNPAIAESSDRGYYADAKSGCFPSAVYYVYLVFLSFVCTALLSGHPDGMGPVVGVAVWLVGAFVPAIVLSRFGIHVFRYIKLG